MVINTANDLKAFLKKHDLKYIDVASILKITQQTASAKVNNLSFTIAEIQELSNYTKDFLIIGMEG